MAVTRGTRTAATTSNPIALTRGKLRTKAFRQRCAEKSKDKESCRVSRRFEQKRGGDFGFDQRACIMIEIVRGTRVLINDRTRCLKNSNQFLGETL
jgi:hypothetical protein